MKRAPWTGGFHERLFGLSKTALKKVLGCSCVSHEDFRTIIVQKEAFINDIPLTYVSGLLDMCEPITPSRTILGYNIISLPNYSHSDMDCVST